MKPGEHGFQQAVIYVPKSTNSAVITSTAQNNVAVTKTSSDPVEKVTKEDLALEHSPPINKGEESKQLTVESVKKDRTRGEDEDDELFTTVGNRKKR